MLPYVITLLIGFIGYWVKELKSVAKEKLNDDMSRNANALLDQLVDMGIDYAQEKGRQVAKKGQEKLKGSDKLAMAVDFVLMQADRHGVKEKAEGLGEDLSALVEAQVSKRRDDQGKLV